MNSQGTLSALFDSGSSTSDSISLGRSPTPSSPALCSYSPNQRPSIAGFPGTGGSDLLLAVVVIAVLELTLMEEYEIKNMKK